MTASIPHPIPYQGSKRRLAPLILRYFPANTGRLVEPFAGSAAVTLAAARAGVAERFHINDTNTALMALWHEIAESPERVADSYAKLWRQQQGRERAFYDEVRDEFNRTQAPALLLYLLARCVKASVRYNANGEFNQSPDNRRKGARPSTMRAHILGASRLLRGRTTFGERDYRDVLSEVDVSALVYMDPPYQGVCTDRDPRYADRVCFGDFVRALAEANGRGLLYIVSYDGRTGSKTFGEPLPETLELLHLEAETGPSSQATLLGRKANTVESLYLSPALVERLGLSGVRHAGGAERFTIAEGSCPRRTTHPSLFAS